MAFAPDMQQKQMNRSSEGTATFESRLPLGAIKKPPTRVVLAPEAKLLVSRDEAAQMLSISQRGLDYLIANQRLATRRIGGRVLIPVADLRRYVRGDHPERIVG